jgi:hypothetical protein
VLGAIFTGVRIAGAIFLGCAGSNVQPHVSPVAARIMVENSMRDFGYDWFVMSSEVETSLDVLINNI